MSRVKPDFRDFNFTSHHWARYGSYHRSYGADEFAYQFGYELASHPLFDGEDWLTVEMNVRREWKQRYPNKEWYEFRDAVRYAWQAVRNSIKSY